jgi:uncharacterized RDD family membrane protein YckC
MTQTPAGPGWYDDPDDPTLLRYFDGVIWTAHTTQRHSPTADASTIGRAPDVPAADARVGWPQQTSTQPGAGQWPGQGQWTGGSAPGPRPGGAYGQAWGDQRGLLPDGAVLAEWWRRLVARILDTLIAGVITLVVAIPWWGDVLRVLSDALDEMSTSAANGGAVDTTRFAEDLTVALLPVTLVNLVVMLVYEVGFLAWRSATPGKMVLGTVVRRTEGSGQIGFVTAVRRQLISVAVAVLAFLPVVNVFASVLNILDPAWLLWDRRRQALHDKVADTVVVMGTPRSGGPPRS